LKERKLITESTFADQSVSDERPSVTGQASIVHELGSIEFRVVRSGLPARRMRLNTTRCTLGSGEGCTVRLNDASLRPMHAVILRDSHRVLLRAYTVPIDVNGLLTGETFLNVGDQFTLGSYHFELTDAPDTLVHQSPVTRVVEAPQSNSAWSEMPLRVAATPLSFTDQDTVEVQLPSSGPSDLAEFANNTEFANQRKRSEASDYGLHNQSAAEKKPTRGRLSFVSGGTYVSEALQAFSTTSPTHRDDAATRSSFRADADHLRNEVDAWRKREQRWKEQDLQTRAELEDAVSRFHESQDRAVQAGQAVAEMRARMEQLGEELAELKNDSTEYRHRAAE